MKRKFWLIVGIVSVFFIAACGHDEEGKAKKDEKQPKEEQKASEDTASSNQGTESKSAETTVKDSQTGNSTTKNTEKEQSSNNQEQKGSSKQTISYQENGKTIEQKADSKSKTDLSIKVLPNYSLDQEEPGIYLVMNEENGTMLRIEKASDESAAELTKEIKMRALAVSNEITRKDTTGTDFEGAIQYQAVHGEDVVNILYLPETKSILTIFGKKNQQAIEPFVAMAKTIEWK
ncbi:hypothetical protein ACE38V_18335 [Cytobacillus sp. Hz8]|uniref:hypothetical protein n=1 Tax=Cytobacillus sp. Hz8 TaxID=3347168 RepID=UPI0035D7614E